MKDYQIPQHDYLARKQRLDCSIWRVRRVKDVAGVVIPIKVQPAIVSSLSQFAASY